MPTSNTPGFGGTHTFTFDVTLTSDTKAEYLEAIKLLEHRLYMTLPRHHLKGHALPGVVKVIKVVRHQP